MAFRPSGRHGIAMPTDFHALAKTGRMRTAPRGRAPVSEIAARPASRAAEPPATVHAAARIAAIKSPTKCLNPRMGEIMKQRFQLKVEKIDKILPDFLKQF